MYENMYVHTCNGGRQDEGSKACSWVQTAAGDLAGIASGSADLLFPSVRQQTAFWLVHNACRVNCSAQVLHAFAAARTASVTKG